MINNRRRNFRPRTQKNNFRRRNGSSNSSNGSNFNNNNGNLNFNRNGLMTNPHAVEKTIQKFQQMAKDAQSNGDPVLVENYLQHADHYARRLAELKEKNKLDTNEIKKDSSVNTNDENKLVSKINNETASSS